MTDELPAEYAADALALHAVDTDDGDGLYSVKLSGGPMVMALTVECPICGVQPERLCLSRDGRSLGLEYVHEQRAEAAPEQCPHYWSTQNNRCLLPKGHAPGKHVWPPGCGPVLAPPVETAKNAPEPSPTVRSTAAEKSSTHSVCGKRDSSFPGHVCTKPAGHSLPCRVTAVP